MGIPLPNKSHVWFFHEIQHSQICSAWGSWHTSFPYSECRINSSSDKFLSFLCCICQSAGSERKLLRILSKWPRFLLAQSKTENPSVPSVHRQNKQSIFMWFCKPNWEGVAVHLHWHTYIFLGFISVFLRRQYSCMKSSFFRVK